MKLSLPTDSTTEHTLWHALRYKDDRSAGVIEFIARKGWDDKDYFTLHICLESCMYAYDYDDRKECMARLNEVITAKELYLQCINTGYYIQC